MNVEWKNLAQPAQGGTVDGELIPLATGQESAAELRSLLIQLTETCPLGKNHHGCPFRLMGKLPDYSVKHLVSTMSDADVRELFRMELFCRKLAGTGRTVTGSSGR